MEFVEEGGHCRQGSVGQDKQQTISFIETRGYEGPYIHTPTCYVVLILGTSSDDSSGEPQPGTARVYFKKGLWQHPNKKRDLWPMTVSNEWNDA